MLLIGLAQLVFLASLAAARRCSVVTVPISISARQGVFNIDLPKTSLDATTLAQNITQQGRNFSQIATAGYATVSGTYNISAQYCTPDNDWSANPTVQVLTHGIGFDKNYWDLPFNNFNYSYVCTAVDGYGYHTVAIDRLGTGLSSHGEPLNEIQAPLEVAALAAITQKLRDGSFPGATKPYKKVVHVGHSFGSAQSYTLANNYPHLTDGIILTGFSTNGTFVPYFAAGANFVQASTNQPFRLGPYAQGTPNIPNADGALDYNAPPTPAPLNYPTGYLINSNIGATQYLFFYPKYFDPALLVSGELTKQPVTPGELLTLPALAPVNAFKGPVLVFTGSNDLPYCGGDCLATGDPKLSSIPAAAVKAFPKADFEAYIQPNTGHGVTTHYNATAGYCVIQEYLARKGLASS